MTCWKWKSNIDGPRKISMIIFSLYNRYDWVYCGDCSDLIHVDIYSCWLAIVIQRKCHLQRRTSSLSWYPLIFVVSIINISLNKGILEVWTDIFLMTMWTIPIILIFVCCVTRHWTLIKQQSNISLVSETLWNIIGNNLSAKLGTSDLLDTVNQLILASYLFSRVEKCCKYKSLQICKTGIFDYRTSSRKLNNSEIKTPQNRLERV